MQEKDLLQKAMQQKNMIRFVFARLDEVERKPKEKEV